MREDECVSERTIVNQMSTYQAGQVCISDDGFVSDGTRLCQTGQGCVRKEDTVFRGVYMDYMHHDAHI